MVKSVQGLNLIRDAVCSSSIFKHAKIPKPFAAAGKVKDLSEAICKHLGLSSQHVLNFHPDNSVDVDTNTINQRSRRRVLEYYTPLALWIEYQRYLQIEQANPNPNPNKEDSKKATKYESKRLPAIVIGLSMPNGCGKTTLTSCLVDALKAVNLKACSVSADDFYKTPKELEKLSIDYPDNVYLNAGRGVPGTHNVELGVKTILDLQHNQVDSTAVIPRYDKSINHGIGDRSPTTQWSSVEGCVDVVLFEGWFLGFQSISVQNDDCTTSTTDTDDVESSCCNNRNARLLLQKYVGMQQVDEMLLKYTEWNRLLDKLIIAKIDDPCIVYRWRQQQEDELKANTGSGMTKEQVVEFVGRFLPTLNIYSQTLYSKGIATLNYDHDVLTFSIDDNRLPKEK